MHQHTLFPCSVIIKGHSWPCEYSEIISIGALDGTFVKMSPVQATEAIC